MKTNYDEIDADKIETVKVIGSGKYETIDINDKKVKTKIKLSQELKDRLIFTPAGKKTKG